MTIEDKLVTWNRIAWALHLVSAVTMSIVATLPATENRREYMLTYQYTSWTDQGLVQENKDAYKLDLAWLITSFSALSFVFQLVADPWIPFYNWKKRVKDGRPNPLRFIEYSISASLMLICIALLSGIRNAMLVAALGLLTAACMLCGLVAEFLLWRSHTDEMIAQRPTYKYFAWAAHLTGWACMIGAYGTLWWSTGVTLSSASLRPPAWVWGIIISQMVLFMSFGAVQLAQFCYDYEGRRQREEPAIYTYAEFWYILLSLTAKFVLAWTIYASALMGDD